METQYQCKNLRRRDAVAGQDTLNGIDFLEVAGEDQKTLKVFFVHPLPGETNPVPPAPALTAENVVIEGGVRIRNVRVESVTADKNVLTITVNEPGDFSTYTLRLVTSLTHDDPPAGFDPRLASVDFSFKVACPGEFDCRTETVCPPERRVEPEINYLAKDYASFRRLLLDRLSLLMPDWRERSPADLQVTLVELLAYVGDHLSYYQDAVATEASLGTARKRVSVRRHARLLDYFIHDGSNARAWVTLTVRQGSPADNSILEKGSRLLTRDGVARPVVAPAELDAALRDDPIVFETMHDLRLHAAQNRISFHTWDDSECCLPRGATRATLRNDPPIELQSGDALLFEELLDPVTGTIADVNPAHRHIVRLTRVEAATDPLDGTAVMNIEWHEDDALPFPLCLSSRLIQDDGTPAVAEISVARGNVVPADHGLTITGEELVPSVVPEEGSYLPVLQQPGLTFHLPWTESEIRVRPAADLFRHGPADALPAVTLDDGGSLWVPRRDLLGSDRFAAEFVVEMEKDGVAHLRFGDDVLGRRPAFGSALLASYRIGNGRSGNVGYESLTRVVTDLDGIEGVRNPVAEAGGADAESLESVRQFAPQAFRVQQRAVTEADYAEVTRRHPGVQKAAARFRWTGSWYTVFVTVDRKGGRAVETDTEFLEEIRQHLEQFRLAGYDLEINGPVFVPLDLLLAVCVKPGHFQMDVKRALLDVFSRHDLPDGRRGFFHPDNFTFGQPVHLSRVYETAMSVDGVASVEVKRFQRFGKAPNQELDTGVLQPASLEIAQLDNDPNFPENGRFEFEMDGGL
jgi:hypothetical protein